MVNCSPLPENILLELQANVVNEISSLSNIYDGYPLQNSNKILDYLNNAKFRQLPVTEEFIKALHTVCNISSDLRTKRAEYIKTRVRKNQDDIPSRMEEFVAWLLSPDHTKIPIPIRCIVNRYVQIQCTLVRCTRSIKTIR